MPAELTTINRLDAARQFLRDAQAGDGGWPYIPGTPSSPEPTCFSLLALSREEASLSQKGIAWLVGRVNAAGAVTLDHDEPHWATALVVTTLTRLDAAADVRDKALSWLLQSHGSQISIGEENLLDGQLRGWPWNIGTFSWVEPTCHAMLALKLTGHGDHPRVLEAERMLVDRICADGGWNYGNHTVLGKSLNGFANTTAWATLALQNSANAASTLAGGLNFLDREIRIRQSALALALTILSFNAFGRPTEELAAALVRRQDADGSWRQNVRLTALAALALHCVETGENIFRVSHD